MRVTCTQCDSRYEIPDEKLASGAVKIRCSRCSHVFVAKRRAAEFLRAPDPQGAAREARFEDFDFGMFESPPEPKAPEEAREAPADRFEAPPSDPQPPAEPQEPSLDDLDLPSLGELDLGDFSLDDTPLDLDEEDGVASGDREPEQQFMEKVRHEELVSVGPASRPAPVQGIAEDIPRLDLQRGPRRSEPPGGPSPLVARDRRRSPLFWIVILAAVATTGFTAYVFAYRQDGLTFLNPSAIRELWRSRKMEARLSVENLQGYYRTVAGGRRFFLIRGEVMNKAGSAQGIIRVKGRLFGPRGAEIASREVYCGNVLTDGDLANLSREAIEARLQNQVGEALSNVDIAPSAKVPFMVVFPSPPDGVEKYVVSVTEAKAGSGS